MKNTFVKTALILGILFVCVLIAGSGTYYWQRAIAQENEAFLKHRIADLEQNNSELQHQIDELGQQLCKGIWKDGACTVLSCGDSDANEKPDDIHIKGIVTFTNEDGAITTIYDECNGSKTQVNEGWCYESPEGSGNYVPGSLVYDCPFGCFEGACNK
ncbi:MAG: hypothetical protein HOP27_08975 [Anaerolineales bacterium]|nr:hypothetical protein [Anaerolineales bacterium]